MKLNYSLDDMRLFWVVSEQGSFVKAAKLLEMPTSTLSRRIMQLEDSLQLRLLNRDAHRLSLTGTGRQYLARCAPLFSELESLSDELYDEQHEAKGLITITAPVQFSHHVLEDMFNEFMLLYPKVQIELKLSDHNIELEKEFIDLALRSSYYAPKGYSSTPLYSICPVLCASSARPEWHAIDEITDFDSMPIVVSRPITTWPLTDTRTGAVVEYQPRDNIRLQVDDTEMSQQAILAGVGIGLLPCFMAKHFLDRGELIDIKSPFKSDLRTIYMIHRDQTKQPYRLRLLINFMMAYEI